MPIVVEVPPWQPCSNIKCWLRLIVLGGLWAGLSFLIFETLASWLLLGRPFVPIRLFAAPILGKDVVASGYPLTLAIPAGLAALAVLSVFCAYVLAALLSQFPKLTTSSVSLIASACTFAYVLWAVDFLLIERALIAQGYKINLHPAVQGFMGHVFFYGMVLGRHMVRNQERYSKVIAVRFRL